MRRARVASTLCGVGLIVLVAVLACIVLAPWFGADSRIDDPSRRWWPGAPR